MRWMHVLPCLLVALVVGLAVTACGESPSPPPATGAPSADLSQPVVPLAKVDGHRAGIGDIFALVEIAYDRAAAEKAWRDNVPEGLPRRDGEPHEPGIYADLADVDFDSHAVIVWSHGQSGFECWGWLNDVQTDGTAVTLTTETVADDCTDDYNAYTMVLAVERDRLPEKSELPVDDAFVASPTGPGVPDNVVDIYPATKFHPSD